MKLRHVLATLCLAASFCACLTSPWHDRRLAAVASPSEEGPDAARQPMEAARQALSRLDAELEFPMSEAEKTASQNDVDRARARWAETEPHSARPEEILSTATAARQLAESALEHARSGNRAEALKNFTGARIKLNETRAMLAQPPSPPADAVTLQGRAQKRTVTVAPAAPSTGLPAGNIKVTPGGVNLGGKVPGAADGGITIGPNGINLGGRAPGASGSIQIGPGGISIRGFDGLEADIAGTINGALGAAGITGSSNAQVFATGNSVNVSANNGNVAYDGQGRHFVVSGHDNNVTIRGTCATVTVSGHSNNISLETVSAITVSGHDNNISWVRAPGGGSPLITESGKDNAINQGRR